MKRAVTLFVLAVLTLAGAPSAAAQKRNEPNRKIGYSEQKLPTAFSNVGAYSDGRGVWFEWTMESENNNFGFRIFRVTEKGSELIAPSKFIGGSAARVGPDPLYGERYGFFDADSDVRSAYYVESLLMDGTRIKSPVFSVKSVSDVSGFAGASSSDPVRRNKETAPELVSSRLKLTRELSSAFAASNALASQSAHLDVISQPGVRIAVRKDGLYRVTKAQLLAAGFNVSSDPATWRLFTEGVEQAVNVGPNGDWIEFYGRGINTIQSDTRMYFLISGNTPGKRMASRSIRPGQSTVLSSGYAQTFTKKERSIYVDTILNGEADNWWGRAITTSPTEIKFDLSGIDTSSQQATLSLKLMGFSNVAHNVDLTLNGVALTSATGNGLNPYSLNLTIPTNILLEGQNSLVLKSGSQGDNSLFDTISIGFVRTYKADQNQLFFHTPYNKLAKVEGFASTNVRLFDVTDVNEPITVSGLEFKATGNTFGFDVPAARGRVYLAVDDPALLQPAAITQYNPEMIGASANAADLVIISHKNFMTESETWANYRRGQGFLVKVVDVSEVFDEFNYGVHGSEAIEAFLQHTAANWQTPPRYVLLMGDASFDPKNYLGAGAWDLVPTRVVNTVFTEAASDEALADFNNDGLAEMAIGRIPVRTSGEATVMFNKVVTWENSLVNPLQRGALFTVDHNIGYDFQAMSNRLRDRLPADMPKVNVNRGDANAKSTVINEINTGKYLVNFTGHGSSGVWAGVDFFSLLDAPQLTNANNQSIFVMLTCLNGYFYNNAFDSLSEALTKAPNGGAVVAWASTGKTTPDVQEIMGRRFFDKLADGSIPRMGDLIKDAKTTLGGGMDVRLSWALIGDPMMKVR